MEKKLEKLKLVIENTGIQVLTKLKQIKPRYYLILSGLSLTLSLLFISSLTSPVSAYTIIIENNVDADSNIDAVANKGDDGATDYTDAQTLDGTDQVITEGDFGGAGVDEWLWCNSSAENSGFDSTTTGWDGFTGASPYLYAIDYSTNYIYEEKTAGATANWFYIVDTTGGTGDYTVNISLYLQGDGNDWVDPVVDFTGSGSGSDQGDIVAPASWAWVTISLGTQSQSNVNNMRVSLVYQGSGKGNQIDVDAMRVGVSKSGASNYQLEWEHQVNSPALDEWKDTYYLCVYGQATGGDSETFEIQMWDYGGSQWGTALSTQIGTTEQWYNQTFSKSTYVDPTNDRVTYRFRGTTESSDTTQSTLNIDWSGVRAYNVSAYNLETLAFGNYDPGTQLAWTSNPLQVQVECGNTYNVQIRGTDTTQTPVASGYVYWNTIDDFGTATALTTSYVNVYTSQSAGNNTHNIYFWVKITWSPGDPAVTNNAQAWDYDILVVEV